MSETASETPKKAEGAESLDPQAGHGFGTAPVFLASISTILGALMFLRFGRDDERQSDKLAIRYMTRSEYDPSELLKVFTMLASVSDSSGAGPLHDEAGERADPQLWCAGDRLHLIGVAARCAA